MKAIQFTLAALLIAQAILPSFASAQEPLAYAPHTTAVTNVPVNINSEKPLISLDEKSQALKVNHSLPPFTYSAKLTVQDFTGRVLRTVDLNKYTSLNQEVSVNDFLAGTYTYTVQLNNQERVSGEFTVNE